MIDTLGTTFFSYGEQVVITDSAQGVLFVGYVSDDQYNKQNTYADVSVEHQITCVDNRHLADKRTSNLTYVTPTSAGKIVTDMIDQVLAAEGVIGTYATQTTSTQLDWSSGTLTNVVAAGSIDDGDLELAGSGGSASQSELAQGDWSANGSLSGVTANSGGDLQLSGASRNWNNGSTSNQTLYGNGNPSQSVNNGVFILSCSANNETRARMDFAGQWANFTATVDMYVGGTLSLNSISYRTTGWNNADQTYAYAVEFNEGVVQLKIGSNNGPSGPASYTLASHTFSPTLSAGWYTIQIVANGNNHQVSVNGTQYINYTQSGPVSGQNLGPYTAAGYLALRNRNLDPTTNNMQFDNFGVVGATSGTWTGTGISINSISSVASSSISWDTSLSQGGTITVQASTNNGSTWQTCSNGGQIPGLSKGTSGSGKTVRVKVTLSASTPAQLPDIANLTWSVVGGYVSSGTRVSGPFSFSGVGQCGSTFIGYNANVPANTSVAIQASPDGSTWYDVTQQNGGALPWINGTPDPTTDGFDGGTLGNYISTYAALGITSTLYVPRALGGTLILAGPTSTGSPATWSVNAGNSRLKATGGANAILYSSLVNAQNVDALVVMDRADCGGLVTNFIDQNDFYLVQVADNQSSNSAPNTISLYKAAGTGVTPLSVYGTSIAAHALSTAGQLATSAGGSDTAVTTKIGRATGWGEICALGSTSSWLASGSAPAPTGKGWLLDSNMLHGQQLDGGNWNMALTAKLSVGTATATLLVRAWAYDTKAQTYTALGSFTLTGQSLSTTKTTYTFPATAFSAYTFNQTQKLYIDCPANITANNTGSTSATIQLRLASTASTGVSGDMEMDTAGFGTPVGSMQFIGSAPISFLRGTYHIVRATMKSGVMTVRFDGQVMLTYTDTSPLGAGFVGLFNNGGATGSRYEYLWMQPQGDDLTNQVVYTKQILSTTDSTTTPQVLDLTVAAFGPQIDTGAIIPSANYAYTFCDKNLDDLAKQSNYEWWIDQDFLMNFNAREGMPSPWCLQSNSLGVASDIEIDSNLQGEVTGDQYRNRQILTNVINSGVFTDTFVGDGSRTSFTLRYPIAPGTVPTVILDGVHQKVGTKGSTGSQWYYAVNDATIAEDNSGTVLTTGDTLSVTYTGLFADTVIVNNNAAQQALAAIDDTSGIVEAVEDVSQKQMTYAAALVYAQALLDRYCVVDANNNPQGTTLTFKTYRGGLFIGQLLPCFFPELNLQDVLLLIHEVQVGMQVQPNNTVLYNYIVTASQLPRVKTFPALLAANLLN